MIEKLAVVRSKDKEQWEVKEPTTGTVLCRTIIYAFAMDWAFGFLECIASHFKHKRESLSLDGRLGAAILGIAEADRLFNNYIISRNKNIFTMATV